MEPHLLQSRFQSNHKARHTFGYTCDLSYICAFIIPMIVATLGPHPTTRLQDIIMLQIYYVTCWVFLIVDVTQ